MTGQLFLPGWETEPCHGAPPDPDEQAHTDLHARRLQAIPGDHGRPGGRGTYNQPCRIHTVKIKGDLL
ncbi:hypothetical protein ACWGDE_01595 [Streptomyces sp. NPDC054956]